MREFKAKFNHDLLLKIMMFYIMLQPFIDFITSFMLRFLHIPVTLGILVRCLFLFILFIYVILKIPFRQHRLSNIFIGTFVIYAICYLIFNFGGLSVLFIEVKGLIKTFFFPITVVLFLDIARYEGFQLEKKYFAWCACLYAAIILLADLTHTSFFSYAYEKVGHVGWFYAANEIGAIIGILSVFAIDYFVHLKNKFIGILLIVLYGFITLIIGTKAPFFAFVLSGIVLFAYYLFKHRKGSLIILPALIVCCLYTPFSNLGSNMGIHLDLLQSKQDDPNQDLELNDQQLTNLVMSSRDLYLKTNMDMLTKSSMPNQLFGIGYYHGGKEYKLVEMDYADILITQGYVGFAMILCLAGYLIFNFIQNIVKKRCKLDDLSFLSLITLGISLGIAIIAGHVLTAPAVSIFASFSIVNCKWLYAND